MGCGVLRMVGGTVDIRGGWGWEEVLSQRCCELLRRSRNTQQEAEQTSCSQRVLGLSSHTVTVVMRLQASPFPLGTSGPASRQWTQSPTPLRAAQKGSHTQKEVHEYSEQLST